MSNVIPISNTTHKLCEVCPFAKQKKLKFHTSTSHVAHAFDLIHCDVWGPFNPCTI